MCPRHVAAKSLSILEALATTLGNAQVHPALLPLERCIAGGGVRGSDRSFRTCPRGGSQT